MKKKLKEQVDAMTAFQSFCNKPENIPIWNHLTAFESGLSKLDLKIREIITAESEQEQDNEGVTQTKKNRKIDMAIQAVAVAAGLQAYSITVDNHQIYFSMNICFSKIMKSKNASAIGACKLIYDTARELPIEEIEPVGISETVLNFLDQAIRGYKGVAASTGNVITNKTVLTNKCARLVKEANTIMRKQLLKMAKSFKKTHPDFYSGLVDSARVRTHSVHSKIRITAVNGEDGTAIEDVLVEIFETDLKGLTNAVGKRTLSPVPEGKRDVTLTKEGVFKQLVLKDMNFQRGKSITRKVEMLLQYNVPRIMDDEKEKVLRE